MAGGSAAFAIQQMLRRLHEDLDSRNIRRRWPSRPSVSSGPLAFALHRHAGNRFELRHPGDWEVVDDASGVLVRPSRLNAFARIDVVPEGRRRWSGLEAWSRREGGRVEVFDRRDAAVELHSARFACVASTRHGGGIRLVLVSGLAVRPSPSPRLRAYLVGALRAIRGHLRAIS